MLLQNLDRGQSITLTMCAVEEEVTTSGLSFSLFSL